MAKLEVKNLTISFRTNNGAVRAVRDISFDLNQGETLAIAGESGSGKSVTTRAIMGILAGNAMVDDGEIIYDGKDLLKIDEEDFHTLRGHKLAMVFQDPLSALNPIMRIGKQLTEAMILNNKERRADGRKRFNSMLAELEKNMVEAKRLNGASEAEIAQVKKNIKDFDHFVSAAVKMENAYHTARENAVSVTDCIDEAETALLQKDRNKVREITGRMVRNCKEVFNPFYIPENDAGFNSLIDTMRSYASSYVTNDEAAYTQAKDAIKNRIETANAMTEPDFFSIGYAQVNGLQYNMSDGIEKVNERCAEELDDRFLNKFREDIAQAVIYSDEQARKAQTEAITVLENGKTVFGQDHLQKNECKSSIRKMSEAVEKAIDKLSIEKDSRSYVFRTSMIAYLERYFIGLKQNPREEKRVVKEKAHYEELIKKGKAAPAVVPANLVDIDKAKAKLSLTVDELVGRFSVTSVNAMSQEDALKKADGLIGYLKDRSGEYAYKLSKGMAKHRAVELMREVGIPEPHKRYTQYPFEFSGGMRQRIVIAIALSANPDILICDEPTTALDVTIQAQILELINRLKVERNLSVIFITHDLGVVANMADRIAIMYAGKIVEYGTADDVFYDPRHPYTWALLASMPDLETKEKLEAIPGTPPDMILPPKGDAFAPRNKYAMQIDFEEQPPMFKVSPTHEAATWLLYPGAPKVDPPAIVTERIERMRRKNESLAEKAVRGGAEA